MRKQLSVIICTSNYSEFSGGTHAGKEVFNGKRFNASRSECMGGK